LEPVRFTNYGELTGHGRKELRADALAIVAAGLRAADPAAELARSLLVEGNRLVVRGQSIDGLDRRLGQRDTVVDLAGRRLFLLGAGKATLCMALVLDSLLGPRFTDAAVIVKRGHASGSPLRYVEVVEAAHPIPDESSLVAGRRLQSIGRQARTGDLVIGLVTGGSSTLAVVPADGISLADKVETNRLLLASGADIVSMNRVRKHLSAIKGGLLGRDCGCEILNFTASDVVGDPLDSITDLTVPDSSTWETARATCDRFGLWDALPSAVAARLRRADADHETPKRLPAVRTWIMADAARMCTAALAEAATRGYAAKLLGLDWEGEARDAGISLARHIGAAVPRDCLIVCGENTVTLATTTLRGHGGGPNQEAALAAALELAPGSHAVVACLDSDGGDGPTDAAGGLVDDLTAAAVLAAGLDAEAALVAHEAYNALSSAGDLIFMGATGTNVNDLKVALRGGSAGPR
jgi:glycerate-2-kinase